MGWENVLHDIGSERIKANLKIVSVISVPQ